MANDTTNRKVAVARTPTKTDPGRPASRAKQMRRIAPLANQPKESQVKGDPPTIDYVDPATLFVDDEYQRNISSAGIRLIEKMVASWEWAKFTCPVVTKIQGGAYLVIDGQHIATAAASHPNIDKIPILVVKAPTTKEQARAFIGHNYERVGMTTLQMHRARLAAGDEEAHRVEAVLGAGGITVLTSVGPKDSAEPNTTMAIHTFYWLLRNWGDAKAKAVAKLLGQCMLRPVRDQHVKAIARLLHGDEYADYIQADKLAEVVQAEPDGKLLGAAKQQSMETGMAAWECLHILYYRRYQEMFT